MNGMSEFTEYLLLCMIFPWYSVYHLVMERKISSVCHFKNNAYFLESRQICVPASLFLKYSV